MSDVKVIVAGSIKPKKIYHPTIQMCGDLLTYLSSLFWVSIQQTLINHCFHFGKQFFSAEFSVRYVLSTKRQTKIVTSW